MDAYNAFVRIQEVFEAESLPDDQIRDPDLENAIEMEDASFSWDVPPPQPEAKKGKGKNKRKEAKDLKKDKKRPGSSGTDMTTTSTSPSVAGSSRVSAAQEPSEKVFKIKKTTLNVPRGQVVAIVGPVGSGKSSLLQGLIGEMRKESGVVKFGGSVSYCPQNAWIQVRPSMSVIICRAKWTIERYHTREHLLRSTLRVGQILASNLRLMP